MSVYEEQVDDLNAICPYCEYSYQVEGEDFDEERQEQECGGCGKTFWLHQSFTVTNHAHPDCKLNDEAHEWMLVELRNGKEAFFCQICGECSLVAEDGTPRAEASHA